jgi:predicted secreted acid phosphatase
MLPRLLKGLNTCLLGFVMLALLGGTFAPVTWANTLQQQAPKTAWGRPSPTFKRYDLLPTGKKQRLAPVQWLQEPAYLAQPKAPATEAQKLANTLGLDHQRNQEKVFYQALRDVASSLPTHRAVVLDLDETVLDNTAFFAYYHPFSDALWEPWILAANARAVPGSLDFIEFLEVHNVPYHFISGRRERWRAATEANLHALGIVRYQGLHLKPNDAPSGQSGVTFKEAVRCQIEAQAKQPLLLLVGDQQSDVKGKCNGQFQHVLPNLLYVLP